MDWSGGGGGVGGLKETISPKMSQGVFGLQPHLVFKVRSIKRAQVFPDYFLCFVCDT